MENPNSPNEPNEAIPEVNPVIPELNHVEDAHDPNKMVDISDDKELVDYDRDEEEPEEEPEPNNGNGDQFAQHPNPQPSNMNGWLEEDDDMNENVNDEDIEDEDVEIEVDDDAELIFPYEVEGDQTPPPRDESSDSEPPIAEPPNAESSNSVSSDSESSDSESEDEEADIAPGPTDGTATQRPFAIHDFLRGIYKVEESSATRDSSYVSGLEPWALRGVTWRLLIGEKERKILDLTLGNVEKTLVCGGEIKILENGENATLKRKLDETETRLAWARMECDTVERSLHESTGWNRRFYWEMVRDDDLLSHRDHLVTLRNHAPPKPMSEARMREIIRDQVTTSMNEFMENMNHGAGGAEAGSDGAGSAGASGAGAGGAGAGSDGAGGAGADSAGIGCVRPVEAEVTGCTYMTFIKCNPHPFKGTEGAVGLCQWFEKLEFVFRVSDCRKKDNVKFATATLQGRALTWWNRRTASMGIDAA
ncbi:hypothetical protein Tco_1289724, partial [Tanacetum coccineum]